MNKIVYTLPLLYLSNFSEGLSHYHWDRAMVYTLNMKIHPGEIINNLVHFSFAKEVVINNTKSYVLTTEGKRHIEKLRIQIEIKLLGVFRTLNRLGQEFNFSENITILLPLIHFSLNEYTYKILFIDNDQIKLYIPNGTSSVVNELDLSIKSVNETDYLADILRANFNLFKKL